MFNINLNFEYSATLLLKWLYALVLFNAPLANVGLNYVYLIPYFFLLVLLLTRKYKINRVSDLFPYILYMLILFFHLIFSLLYLDVGNKALVSFSLYLFPILLWFLIFSIKTELSYQVVFLSTLNMCVIIALLGCVQFLYSPNLFGYIPEKSMQISAASKMGFEEYSNFFRATSTLGSPQVFGLFCTINLLLVIRYASYLKKVSFVISMVSFTLGGVLSGNKLFFVVLILFLVILYYRKALFQWQYFLLVLIFLFISILSIEIFVSSVPMLERIFDTTQIMTQEQAGADGRLNRYAFIFKNANPFFGEGLGVITNTSIEGLRAPESYFFKLYYEAGLLGLIPFIIICGLSYVISKSSNTVDGVIVMLTVFSLLVVHAYESPVFILLWGHLLGGGSLLYHKDKNLYVK